MLKSIQLFNNLYQYKIIHCIFVWSRVEVGDMADMFI
jgi:hypothetical protein